MSVGISADIKFDIVEAFQQNGNKTRTGELFGVSARTVGRIMKEYDWVMLHSPYDSIYTKMDLLVMPDDMLYDCIFGDDAFVDFDFLCSFEEVYDTKKYDTIHDFIHDLEDTFREVFKRAELDKVLSLDDEELFTFDLPNGDKGRIVDDNILEPNGFVHWVDVPEVIKQFNERYSIDVAADRMEPYVLEELLIDVEDDEFSVDNYDWNLIATAKSITVTKTSKFTNETQSVEIAKGSENFRNAWAIIRNIDMSDEDEVAISADEIYTMADPKSAIEKFSQGKLTVDVKTETIYYDGNAVHNSLTNRIINMVMMRGIEGGQALINFLEKLMENPSYRAVNSLYDFLVHNDIEINSEGKFYAWKRVRSDFTDCHTGTFDNSVGAEPTMPRNMVNEDPEQTCSAGLHVAAKHYLGSFHGDVIVKCEVDPKDVVAVPVDYNNSKMRTSRYKVVEDVTGMEY